MMLTFSRPIYLVLLILIPLIVLTHFIALKRKRVHALKFANFDAIARVKGIDLLSKNIFILILTIIILIALTLSVSGLTYHRVLYSSTFSFVVAIDSSKSMEATDFTPNRLEAAKETASFFVDITPSGTKIGVISFSGNAFISQRLTDDKILIRQAIKEIPLSAIGGTDINEAVITSSNLLEGEEARSVIILSDGRINVGTIDEAISYANNNDVVVHTVGIGTSEGGLTSFGLSKIDEDSLKAVAFNTNGKYFKAENKEELENAFNNILNLRLKKVSLDLSRRLLLLAIMLIVIEYVLVNTRYRILP